MARTPRARRRGAARHTERIIGYKVKQYGIASERCDIEMFELLGAAAPKPG